MKHLVTFAALTLTGAPAFAHGSGHLHPHGTEIATVAIALAAAALFAVLRRR